MRERLQYYILRSRTLFSPLSGYAGRQIRTRGKGAPGPPPNGVPASVPLRRRGSTLRDSTNLRLLHTAGGLLSHSLIMSGV
jgi:hypothetical protein